MKSNLQLSRHDPTFINEARIRIEKAYNQIGCKPKFTTVPGRRGIDAFNSYKVDGEVARIPNIIDKVYNRPYIVSIPVIPHEQAWFRHPYPKIAYEKPLGYLLGALWQENFVKGKKGTISQSSDLKVMNLYKAERIGQFLSDLVSIEVWMANNPDAPKPVIVEVLKTQMLHHILSDDFREVSEVLTTALGPEGYLPHVN